MTASKRRVLIKNLVAGSMGMTINKDHLHAGCFERSESLTQLTKSDAYSKNRPHPAASKIHIPLTRTHIEEGSYFVAPSEVSELEEVISRKTNDNDIHESSEVISE